MAKKETAVEARRPPPRPVAASEAKRPGVRGPPPLDTRSTGEEHRQFPRAKMEVPFVLWIEDDGDDKKFSATLRSVNLSVSGAFLESTFFLPVGTELRTSFQLDEEGEAVQARCQIVRQDRTDNGRTGMAIRFVEFFQQTEVTLARLFLATQLTNFAEGYLSSKRA